MSIVTTQLPVPEQGPYHPENWYPLPAVAVKLTLVPLLYEWLQLEPQLIPEGELVTEPEPVTDTVREYSPGLTGAKLAVTERLAVIVKVQAPLPKEAQLPPQPEKT